MQAIFPGVYKVPTNLISFSGPLKVKLVGVDKYLSCELVIERIREGQNRKGRKLNREGGKAQTEKKENQVGKKGKGRREGN